MTIISIVSDLLVAVKHGVVTAQINNLTDFYRVVGSSYSVSFSSSVDFPEEFTSRPEVIALCREIRGL